MGCNQSFTSSTDAIMHDSDPKPIDFVQIQSDGTEVTLGQTLDMGLIVTPAIIPGTPGPTVDDLDSGEAAGSDPVTFRHLNAGSVTLTLTPDGAISSPYLTVTVTAANLAALAIAQGHGDQSLATIDITSLCDPEELVSALEDTLYGGGTPFTNMTYNVTAAFEGDNGTITFASCAPQTDDSISDKQNLGSAFLINSIGGGSSDSPVPFRANHVPQMFMLISLSSTGMLHNFIKIEMKPPVPQMHNLTSGSVSIILTLDDASTIGPLDITATELNAISPTADELIVLSSNPEILWDLSGLVGRSIVSYTYTVAGFVASPVPLLNGPGNCFLSITLDGNESFLDSMTVFTPGIGSSSNLWTVGPFATTPVATIHIKLTAQNVFGNIPMSATDIQAMCDAGQLASQDADILVSLSPYAGYTIVNITGNFYASYGPASNAFPSVVFGSVDSYVTPFQYASGSLSAAVGTFWGGLLDILLNSESAFHVHVLLYPASTPATRVPIIFTQPYEIRQRNQAAFRLIITPAPGSALENTRMDISMWQSMDKKFWTPTLPVVMDTDGVSLGGLAVHVPIPNAAPIGLPANYSGILVQMPYNLAYSSPANYIRLMFTPYTVEESEPPDLTGWTMQAIANAREL